MKIKAMLCLLLVVVAPIGSQAQTSYSWSGGTDTNWSTTGNWTPTSGSGTTYPASGDTAILGSVSANRAIIYDSAASGTIGALSITQSTAGFINQLTAQSSLTVSSDIALGATAGTSLLYVGSGASTAGVTLTVGTGSGTLTVGSGGVLQISSYQPSTVSGNVVLNGGSINVEKGITSGTARTDYINGSLTISSGVITLGTTALNSGYTQAGTDTRLQINGNFIATGGSIVAAPSTKGYTSLTLMGATNDFSGLTAFDSKINVYLSGSSTTGSANQSLNLGAYTPNSLILRNEAAVTASKTISSSATGKIGAITFDGRTTNATIILALGSDLTLASGAAMPTTNTYAYGSRLNYTIDTGSYTFDMSAGAGAFKAVNQSTTPTYWTLQGNGTIKARSFILSTAYRSTVSGSVTLQVTGSPTATTGTVIDLSDGTSSSTISATSTLLYSGSDTATAAATLISNRTIGNLGVTSGYLKINQANLTTGGNVTVSGGYLDLNGTGTAGLLTLASNKNFTQTGGTLVFDVGTAFDQIIGSGTSIFTLSNATLALTLGTGFDYNSTYALFSGFASGSTSNLTITGVDSAYTATLGSNGVLSFQQVPEPSSLGLMLLGAAAMVGAAVRRKRS